MTSKSSFPDCCSEVAQDWDLSRIFSELLIKKKKLNQRYRVTERDKEYICLLLCKKSLQEIASDLVVAYSTVQGKASEIYQDIELLTGLATQSLSDVYINLDKSGYKKQKQSVIINLTINFEKLTDQQRQEIFESLNKIQRISGEADND